MSQDINKTILTDEEVESIISEAESNVSKDTELLRNGFPDIPRSVVNYENTEITDTAVGIDPNTGMVTILPNDNNFNDNITLTDIVSGNLPTFNSDILKELSTTFNITTDDAFKLLNTISVFNFDDDSDKLYHKLPIGIKNIIDSLCPSKKSSELEQTARELLRTFKAEMEIDQSFIDLQASIEKELKLGEMNNEYFLELKKNMEVDLFEKANKLESEFPEQAKQLRAVSKAFTDSYTFSRVIDYINNPNKNNRRAIKDTVSYDYHCNKFNNKYKYSKFNIKDIRMIAPILNRKLPKDINEKSIISFIIAICRTCRNMDPENPADHAFMYYTISNIAAIDFIKNPEEYESTKMILDNVIKCIRLIEGI